VTGIATKSLAGLVELFLLFAPGVLCGLLAEKVGSRRGRYELQFAGYFCTMGSLLALQATQAPVLMSEWPRHVGAFQYAVLSASHGSPSATSTSPHRS
jgi:hypothetical protein